MIHLTFDCLSFYLLLLLRFGLIQTNCIFHFDIYDERKILKKGSMKNRMNVKPKNEIGQQYKCFFHRIEIEKESE